MAIAPSTWPTAGSYPESYIADSMASPRILIADDQPDVLEALRLLLKPEGFVTEQANSPAAVLSLLDNREFDGAVIDLNYARDTTSGAEGLDLLSSIQARDALLRLEAKYPGHTDVAALRAKLEAPVPETAPAVSLEDENEPEPELHVLAVGINRPSSALIQPNSGL